MPRIPSILLAAAAAALTLAPATPARAGCDFEHPRKAKVLQASLVQPFVSCATFANTTSASGIPGCTPPATFNQQAGTPLDGWQWDEHRSSGEVILREVGCKAGPPNCRDLKIKLRLRRILDGTGGPANGIGTLAFLARATQEDTVVSAPGMGTDVTFVDFPAPFPITVVDGNGTLGGSNVVVLSDVGTVIPGCTSIEFIAIHVLDPNGNAFARPGIFFKNLPN